MVRWRESKEAQRNWPCLVHLDSLMHGWQPEVLQVACLILWPSKLGKRLRCDRTRLSCAPLVKQHNLEVIHSLSQPS